jgi:hypothetical protein
MNEIDPETLDMLEKVAGVMTSKSQEELKAEKKKSLIKCNDGIIPLELSSKTLSCLVRPATDVGPTPPGFGKLHYA